MTEEQLVTLRRYAEKRVDKTPIKLVAYLLYEEFGREVSYNVIGIELANIAKELRKTEPKMNVKPPEYIYLTEGGKPPCND
jgi:hypothetical protein